MSQGRGFADASARSRGDDIGAIPDKQATGRGGPAVQRALGATLVLIGVLGLAYCGLVLFWKDPATSLYAHYEQNRLEVELARDWREPARLAAVVEERRVLPTRPRKTRKPKVVKQQPWKAPREGKPVGGSRFRRWG